MSKVVAPNTTYDQNELPLYWACNKCFRKDYRAHRAGLTCNEERNGQICQGVMSSTPFATLPHVDTIAPIRGLGPEA